MLTKKCAVLRIVHGNARSKPPEHYDKEISIPPTYYGLILIRSLIFLWRYLLRANHPKRRNSLKKRRICDQAQRSIRRLDAERGDAGRAEIGDIKKRVRDVHGQKYRLRCSN